MLLEVLFGVLQGLILGLCSLNMKALSPFLLYLGIGTGVGDIVKIIVMEAILSGSRRYSGSYSRMLIRTMFLIGGIFLIITNTTQYLKIGMDNQVIALGIASYVWARMIQMSKDKLGAIASLIAAIGLGIFSIRLPGTNHMLAIIVGLYGIGGILESLRYEKTEETKEELNGYISLNGIFAGVLSGIFWGLPASALARVTKDKDEDESILMGSAEGAASAFALIMALGKGSKGGMKLSFLNHTSLNPALVIGLILISISVSVISYYSLGSINLKVLNYKLFKLISLVASICLVINSLEPIVGCVLIFSGLCLKRTIKESHAPQELSLSAISAIPLYNLIG